MKGHRLATNNIAQIILQKAETVNLVSEIEVFVMFVTVDSARIISEKHKINTEGWKTK